MVEAALLSGEYAERALDEWLILDIHRQICGDLVPAWAGKWREIEVSVGRLRPAPPHSLPVLMRDYALDLQARWEGASREPSELTLELLAFAEGRFLTVHPFQDFNGRTIRLWLIEILRRLDLPVLSLAAETEAERAVYFRALEAADELRWEPLMDVWRARLGMSE
jgi:CRISPR-associated endonuclease/helicase Cas3